IENAKVKAVDQGALDCVIKARTFAAAQRATGTAEEPVWEVF
ncbi:citrate lyase ACP, partial [Pediococcus acidilactici]